MPARVLLGDMLRTEDRIQEACTQYRKIIAEQPWSGMAWWGLADLKALHFSPADIEQMRNAMQDSRANHNDMIDRDGAACPIRHGPGICAQRIGGDLATGISIAPRTGAAPADIH